MGRTERATVKLAPLTLPASAEVRLRRLAPGATYQADQHRLLLPVVPPPEGSGYAKLLVELLTELVPTAA
jgi:transcription-repair coupling factor (superfamily II helicase)